ncbi:hypothetical protein G5V59_16440 [Nocardioides sp. W3-2-3]|uniref:hypothetical protein n=1 Tax=Nocardioides convexus TaxID=2712224 RepID=UPI0024189261|nr:hypothetical protein [Nocardioides convexus]NHA00957.1 hypothetical protein [Nocardioides convexus]
MSHLSALPTRAARWSATHPWRAIGAWLLLVVVAVGLAAAVPTQQVSDADYRTGDSGRAETLLDDAGLDSPPTENVLVTARSGALDAADARAAAADVRARMTGLKGVADVGDPVTSADRSAVLVPVEPDLRRDRRRAAGGRDRRRAEGPSRAPARPGRRRHHRRRGQRPGGRGPALGRAWSACRSPWCSCCWRSAR